MDNYLLTDMQCSTAENMCSLISSAIAKLETDNDNLYKIIEDAKISAWVEDTDAGRSVKERFTKNKGQVGALILALKDIVKDTESHIERSRNNNRRR